MLYGNNEEEHSASYIHSRQKLISGGSLTIGPEGGDQQEASLEKLRNRHVFKALGRS